MPRYKLFLLERPTGDARTIQRATWALPSALDVARLGKALKGEIEIDWLEIAASDKKREILKIQHELAKHGCMLAIDDAGGTLTKDLTGAIRQALSREGRRQSRERARAASIWERGEGWRAVPVALARNARAIVSTIAALAVVGGSVVLLTLWMNGAPRAREGGADASALDRLAALSRGDAHLPAIPESADGSAGASEPGEPVSRGSTRPQPAADADGGRPAIPDVPSGGTAAAIGPARAPRSGTESTNDTRSIEVAGFAVGIGWAALIEGFARRGARQGGGRSRSRAVLMRLVPAALAAGLTVGSLVVMEARTAPVAHAASTKRARRASSVGPASRHEGRREVAPSPSAASAPAATKPTVPSYRALLASLAPSPDPCAQANGSFARFLCLEHLRHPSASAAGEGDEPAAVAADTADATGAGAAAGRETRPRSGEPRSSEPLSGAPAVAASRATSANAASSAVSSAPASAPSAPPAAPRPASRSAPSTAAASRSAPASPPPTVASPGGAPRPLPSPAPSPSLPPPAPPPESVSAPVPTPAPAVSTRRDLLAALPTFLLGLLAGMVGLAIVALGVSGGASAEERAA